MVFHLLVEPESRQLVDLKQLAQGNQETELPHLSVPQENFTCSSERTSAVLPFASSFPSIRPCTIPEGPPASATTDRPGRRKATIA